MVENQHQKISGYRDLTQDEIDYINHIKQLEQEITEVWEKSYDSLAEIGATHDQWDDLRSSKEAFKHGFMTLIRSIAKPDSPWSKLDL